MSVHEIDRREGVAYEARWRDLTGAQRARRFDTPDAAGSFDTAIRARIALSRAQARWDSVSRTSRRDVERELAATATTNEVSA